jgi:hypothetical protein
VYFKVFLFSFRYFLSLLWSTLYELHSFLHSCILVLFNCVHSECHIKTKSVIGKGAHGQGYRLIIIHWRAMGRLKEGIQDKGARIDLGLILLFPGSF